MELLLDMILGISVSVGIGLLWVRLARGRIGSNHRTTPQAAPAGDEAAQALAFSSLDNWDWDEDELPVEEAPIQAMQEDLPPIADVPAPAPVDSSARRLRVELRERAERIDELERAVGSLSSRFVTCLGRDPDSLQILRGIGPGYEKALARQGIHTVPELARLRASEFQRLQQEAPALYRRMCALKWVEQARELMQGSVTATT